MSMQKQKNFQVAVIGVLAFAVLFMSVGFAAYSQQLNINGAATVAANKWSIHFKENSIQQFRALSLLRVQLLTPLQLPQASRLSFRSLVIIMHFQ